MKRERLNLMYLIFSVHCLTNALVGNQKQGESEGNSNSAIAFFFQRTFCSIT